MNCDDGDKNGNSTGNEANSSYIYIDIDRYKALIIEYEAFISSNKD